MRIPSAIDRNVLKAYEPHPRVVSREQQSLESFNFDKWDQQLPKTLRELCVEAIAKNWADNPVLNEIVLPIDRYFLLDILDTDLPLKLTIPKIPDDIYWKRCYLEKWPLKRPVNVKPIEISEIFMDNDIRRLSSVYTLSESRNSSNGSQTSKISEKSQRKSLVNERSYNFVNRTWKEYYVEMYLKDYLENLKPEDYNGEKMKGLSDLCSDYVRVLRIEQMRCSENSSNRIPLNSILNGFQHLKELSICFKQSYIGEQFSWNVLNTAFQDIRLLGKGLEKLRLSVLRIRNSDINCEKLIVILKALLKHEIKTLDFYHCKIADRGTLAISKFIMEVPVKGLNLANNRVGPKGIEYLSYALRQPNCALTELDLHLNELSDDVGNLLLDSVNPKTMKSLILSGCGFSGSLDIGRLLKINLALGFLDFSNNNLGENVGQHILEGLKYNSTIKQLDLRMCKIPTEAECKIQELVSAKKRAVQPIIESVQDDAGVELCTEDVFYEFETILQ